MACGLGEVGQVFKSAQQVQKLVHNSEVGFDFVIPGMAPQLFWGLSISPTLYQKVCCYLVKLLWHYHLVGTFPCRTDTPFSA